MPVIVTRVIRKHEYFYWHDSLREVTRIELEQSNLHEYISNYVNHLKFNPAIPIIRAMIKAFLLEIRNNVEKLVKRFKPPEQIEALYVHNPLECLIDSCEKIYIPRPVALRLNILLGYQVTLLLTEVENIPLLPYEVKPADSKSTQILDELPESTKQLFILMAFKSTLREPVSHLLDAYWRFEEGDIEGARTSIRNALECLEKIVRNLEVSKESITEREVENFPDRLLELIKKLKNLVHYGGPHPGPAPKTTTEMVLEMTTALVKGLDKALNKGILRLKQS